MEKVKKILFLVNKHTTILGFREEVVCEFVNKGYDVYISCPDSKYTPNIKNLGVKFLDIAIEKRGKNPLKEFKIIKEYKKLLKSLKPDLILTYTIKPNVYGNYVAHKFHIPVISTVTGLGDAVLGGGMLSKLTWFLLKQLNKANTVFFQNDGDMELCHSKKIALKNSMRVSGSGVNLERFVFKDYPENKGIVNFLYMGRIYRQKGVFELKEAYERLWQENKNISLTIVGDYKIDAVGLFDNLENENIFFKGYQDEVRPYIEKADVIVNPSYREGMSNVLLESASMGRPLLASNISGCKEAIDKSNGLTFTAQDVDSLYNAMKEFTLLDYEKRKEMGKNSRIKVEKEFDRKVVVKKYFNRAKEIMKV